MTGLREQKKQATREALQEAALRLALEQGPEHVRVDDIAAAAGVSPRTYNNYFPGREHAIVAAVTAARASQLAAAVTGRAAEIGLADAVTDAVVGEHADPGDETRAALLMITTNAALRSCYVDSAAAWEVPLAAAILERAPDLDPLTAEVLAASVAAAARLALRRWLSSVGTPASMPGFVMPSGSLPDLIRAALLPLAPALDAAATAR